MWVDDIKKALFFFVNEDGVLIDRIENGYIIFTNHKYMKIESGVKAYNRAMFKNDWSEVDRLKRLILSSEDDEDELG